MNFWENVKEWIADRIGCLILIVFVGLVGGSVRLVSNVWEIRNEKAHRKEIIVKYTTLLNNNSLTDFRKFFEEYEGELDEEKEQNLLQRYYDISLDSCYATLGKYQEFGDLLSGIGYLESFAKTCQRWLFIKIANEKTEKLVDSLYAVALSIDSYRAWENYQSAVPTNKYRDSENKKQAAMWSTDSRAWQTASEINTITAYERYLELYPNGRHKSKAIDKLVSATFKGEHGSLPEMNKTSYGRGSTSSIQITNKTEYKLTLLYSGTESKRLVLDPYVSGTIRLKNGSYRIAASVDASNVSRYTGTENLDGGSYEITYYIETSHSSFYRKY